MNSENRRTGSLISRLSNIRRALFRRFPVDDTLTEVPLRYYS